MKTLQELLDEIRKHGYSVAVHNDYYVKGEFFTFWLFTHNKTKIYVKGEGKTDKEALQICLNEINNFTSRLLKNMDL